MFTGLIEAKGVVDRLTSEPPAIRLAIREGTIATDLAIGDSVAVNGCCLTVVRCEDDQFEFQAGAETLARTNLGQLAVGSLVNLERSLRVGDRLGGHFVTGHIDGLGEISQRTDHDEWSDVEIAIPPPLVRYLAPKGSIAVDGTSLTVVDVRNDIVSVMLIPHTLAHTTLGTRQIGDNVNIETDLLAKYVLNDASAMG